MAISTESTRRVRDALEKEGMGERLLDLDETARSAEDAASSLGTEVGAIVKTLIFRFEVVAPEAQVFAIAALVSGDRFCNTDAIGGVIGQEGKVKRPNADEVKEMTGYSIGGVSPVALPEDVMVLIDDGLGRHTELWAAAGHPHCVFRTNLAELERLTGGRITSAIGIER